MKISSSYNSQIMSLVRDTAIGKSKDRSKKDIGNDTPLRVAASIGYGQGYTSLQNTLSGLNVDSALGSASDPKGATAGIYGYPFSTLSPTMTNSRGETLGEIQAANHTYNPADWLTDSDKALFNKASGGTIKDGVIYSADGGVDNSSTSFDFANTLFEMRNDGVVDGSGNRYAIKGDITAQDLQNFIAAYRSYGDTNSANYDLLQKSLDALS